ncbi:endonuclease/exonuclease/phosphatase family protein [Patescibacteria group bacterium]|nr:endonuclease/exonuclease/phosphatase family protein [Patescibacteria group bacterium]
MVTVASWNIAGGRKMKSPKMFDYSDEDLGYFAEQIQKVSPDIICLQETHTNKNRSIAKEIAGSLGMNFVFDSPASPSHVDKNYTLGNAIISKYDFTQKESFQLPDPTFDLYFSDGKKAKIHQRKLQLVVVKNTFIANIHMSPLHIFGYDYAKDKGLGFAHAIEKLLLAKLQKPLIFCGDFNYNTPQTIYPNLISTFNLKDSVPDKLTAPCEKDVTKSDHIFYSEEFTLVNSGVIETETDHYLCYISFNY